MFSLPLLRYFVIRLRSFPSLLRRADGESPSVSLPIAGFGRERPRQDVQDDVSSDSGSGEDQATAAQAASIGFKRRIGESSGGLRSRGATAGSEAASGAAGRTDGHADAPGAPAHELRRPGRDRRWQAADAEPSSSAAANVPARTRLGATRNFTDRSVGGAGSSDSADATAAHSAAAGGAPARLSSKSATASSAASALRHGFTVDLSLAMGASSSSGSSFSSSAGSRSNLLRSILVDNDFDRVHAAQGLFVSIAERMIGGRLPPPATATDRDRDRDRKAAAAAPAAAAGPSGPHMAMDGGSLDLDAGSSAGLASSASHAAAADPLHVAGAAVGIDPPDAYAEDGFEAPEAEAEAEAALPEEGQQREQ